MVKKDTVSLHKCIQLWHTVTTGDGGDGPTEDGGLMTDD